MGEFVTTGSVKQGRLEIRRRQELRATIARWRDGDVLITITPRRAARSVDQNAWYWGVIVEHLSEHTGHTPDELHELLKAMFLPKRLAVQDQNGEIQGEYVIGGSTTKLNKLEFGDYCERIRQWASDTLGVVIPDPDRGALWPGARQQWAS
jgi:hypothetical protein